jgi:catechol 2,3-dioxygenase-like lactoylglutathione lyase family enzyme
MIQQLDHLVILVDDLEAARRDYTMLGFNVVPGGEHSDGATHNALIAFADGTYLELLAFRRDAPEHRWWRHTAHGEGLIDWALLPSDTAEDVAAAKERGLIYDGPTDGGRVRPDGVELRWQTALPPSPDLPFLCGDVTPRDLRVPSGAAHIHPNGATGIRRLTIGVADLDASVARYEALLGRPSYDHNEEVALLPLNDSLITLSGPGKHGNEVLERQLAQRGEGPWSFEVRIARGSVYELDRTRTHGVHIVISPDELDIPSQ